MNRELTLEYVATFDDRDEDWTLVVEAEVTPRVGSVDTEDDFATVGAISLKGATRGIDGKVMGPKEFREYLGDGVRDLDAFIKESAWFELDGEDDTFAEDP